jgi:hypothetical protein
MINVLVLVILLSDFLVYWITGKDGSSYNRKVRPVHKSRIGGAIPE